MSIIVNNVEITDTVYNDTDLDKVIFNDVEVFNSMSWANATDEKILAMVQAADRGEINLTDYWNVGDVRKVNLSAMSASGVGESHVAQTVELVLVAKDTGVQNTSNPCYNYQYLDTSKKRKYPSFIVQQKNGLADANNHISEFGYINSSGTNAGGWNGCARRTWCNNVYKSAMPSSLVSAFKQVLVKTMNNGSQSGAALVRSADYFFLPAEKEVIGSASLSSSVEANVLSQWQYYENSENRIKRRYYNGGTAAGWWERSTSYGGATKFCTIAGSGAQTAMAASKTYIIAPAGCI